MDGQSLKLEWTAGINIVRPCVPQMKNRSPYTLSTAGTTKVRIMYSRIQIHTLITLVLSNSLPQNSIDFLLVLFSRLNENDNNPQSGRPHTCYMCCCLATVYAPGQGRPHSFSVKRVAGENNSQTEIQTHTHHSGAFTPSTTKQLILSGGAVLQAQHVQTAYSVSIEIKQIAPHVPTDDSLV